MSPERRWVNGPRPSDDARRRRRRRPEEAEAEILAAAGELFTRRPPHDVTIGAIMARTTLTRKSFYVYFKDRFELLTRLIQPLQDQRDEIVDEFYRADDPLDGARTALVALARLYAEHGRLLRAIAYASDQDAQVRRVWRGFLEPVVVGHAELIRTEIERGRITGLDPEPTARALIGMNLQVYFDELVDDPDADVEAVAETLLRIWVRALYGVGGDGE